LTHSDRVKEACDRQLKKVFGEFPKAKVMYSLSLYANLGP